MSNIRRYALVQAVIDKLETITVANGYKNDFPTPKLWSPEIEVKNDQLVCNVKDIANTFEDNGTRQILTIEILLGCVKGSLNYITIINMMDDVYRCLFTNELALSVAFGKVEIIPQGDELEIEQYEREVAVAKMTFDFFHLENARWIYDSTAY